jgi:aspartyl protease
MPRAAAVPAASSDPITLPVELANGHVLVPAAADGRPVSLVLDTGSSTSTLDAVWARQAGIQPLSGVVEAVGADRVQVPLATIGRLGIAGVELAGITVALLPFGPVVEAAGRVIHGTLGYDLFGRYAVEIDYAGRKLRLWEPERFSPTGGVPLPIELVYRVPVLRAALRAPGGAPVEARLILDLGSSSLGVRLSARFARAHAAELAGVGGYETPIGTGVGGMLLGRVGRLEEIGLGPIGVRGPTVGIALEDKGALALPQFDGTVGAPVLERLKPIVDYARSRVIVEPGAGPAAPFAADASGLLLDSPAPDFSVARVRFVARESAGTEAGIEPGDEIVTVDGAGAGELGLSRVRELLRDAGAERRLALRCGAEAREVRLRLRALV